MVEVPTTPLELTTERSGAESPFRFESVFALHRRVLRRLEGVDRRELPVAYQVLHYPVRVLEERQVIGDSQGRTQAAIQSRGSVIAREAGEVLRTTRRQYRREDVCRRVVEGVAPGEGRLELQAVGEVPFERHLQAVVVRLAVRLEGNNVGTVEASISPNRIQAADGFQASQSRAQRIQISLSRIAGERRQVVGRRYRCLDIQTGLNRQIDTAGSDVAHFQRVLVGEDVLYTRRPGFRVRQRLVRNVRTGALACTRRIGDRLPGCLANRRGPGSW